MLYEGRQHQETWEKEQMSVNRNKQIPDPLSEISSAVAAEVVVKRWHDWNYFIFGHEMQHCWYDPDTASNGTRLVVQTIMGRWAESKMTPLHFMTGGTKASILKNKHTTL